jgi:hypothetical protein
LKAKLYSGYRFGGQFQEYNYDLKIDAYFYFVLFRKLAFLKQPERREGMRPKWGALSFVLVVWYASTTKRDELIVAPFFIAEPFITITHGEDCMKINFFIALMIAFGSINISAAQNDWTLRNPSPTSADLKDVTYGNGKFIAIGSPGELVSSSDGIHWTRVFPETKYSAKTIAWTHSTFIAVGDSGLIVTSPDGSAWTIQNSTITENLNDVIWAEEDSIQKFIAVGMNGVIVASPDGISWTKQVSNPNIALSAICEGFPVLGNGVQSFGRDSLVVIIADTSFFISTNGTLWFPRSFGMPSCHFKDVAWAGDKFVAVGDSSTKGIIISSDTLSGLLGGALESTWLWSKRKPDALKSYTQIKWLQNTFVVLGTAGSCLSSPDGITWTTKSQPLGGINSIANDNGLYIAVSDSGKIFTSGDLSGWAEQSSSITRAGLSSVAWGNNKFIAVGDSIMLSSSDGINWQKIENPDGFRFLKVAAKDDLFVVLGKYPVGPQGIFLTSSDGNVWNKSILYGSPTDVAFGKDLFIIAEGGLIVGSNGIQTEMNILYDKNLSAISWGNDAYVGYGSYSPDGYMTRSGFFMSKDSCCNWHVTSQNSTYSKGISDIEWGNNRFVAVGWPQQVYISIDGENWGDSSTANTPNISQLHWLNDMFYGVGNDTVYTSANGINWTKTCTFAKKWLSDIAFSGDRFVGVGGAGTIISSPHNSANRKTVKAGTFGLSFSIGKSKINYYLPTINQVIISIFDTKGRLVRTLMNRIQQGGYHSIDIPTDLNQGMYIVSCRVDGKKVDRTVVVLR